MGERPLRIMQVIAGLHLGGAEQLAASLAAWLQAKGHVVVVSNLTAEQAMAHAFERESLKVIQTEDRGILSRFYPRRLVRLMRQFRPDVVHCHSAAWFKTAVACRWARVPCVFTLHGFRREWLAQQKRWLRFAAKYTTYCVGVAPGMENLFMEILDVPAERVRYLRNGVPDIFMPNPPPPNWRISIPSNASLVAMVGRFDGQWKDQPTLVKAVQLARQSIPELHLVFIGDGLYRPTVEKMVQDVGAQEYVHFLGLRDDVAGLLHHIHLFVLSSRSEGESLAILEAMSAQRPIIATAVGGTPGLLANGECGVLVPPGDVQAMAQAIVELLTNQEKAQELARRARQCYLENYTIDVMANRYLELYQLAVKKHRKASGGGHFEC